MEMIESVDVTTVNTANHNLSDSMQLLETKSNNNDRLGKNNFHLNQNGNNSKLINNGYSRSPEKNKINSNTN